jgi:hypothetical protein
LRVAGVLVALLVVTAAAVVWWVLRVSVPVASGTLPVAGVSAPVTVFRDHAGVPHIFADSAADGVRALGFVQARDRRLQMELARLAGQGRLAEVLGDRRAPGPLVIAGVVGASPLDVDVRCGRSASPASRRPRLSACRRRSARSSRRTPTASTRRPTPRAPPGS